MSDDTRVKRSKLAHYTPVDVAGHPETAALIEFLHREAGVQCLDGLEFGVGACGRGVFATRRFVVGDTMVRVPLSLVVSEDRARESIVGQTMLRLHQHQVQVARAASSPAPAAPKGLQMLLMFAIHSRATPSARWHAYFRFIPQSYEDPLWWTGDELRHLLGTNLGIGVRHRRRHLREAYDALVPALSAFAPDVFPPEVFTWEAYLWASSAYTSRSYVGHLGRTQASAARPLVGNFVSKQDGDENQEEEQLCGCMIPLEDIFNHQYRKRVTWHSDQNEVRFVTDDDIECGTEVFNNYGGKSNEEFLLGFGFCVRNNTEDTVAIQIGLRQSSSDDEEASESAEDADAAALLAHQTRLLKQLQVPMHHYLRGDERWLPSQLLPALRVCALSVDELQRINAAHIDSTSIVFNSRISWRNELAALQALRSLLIDRLRFLSIGHHLRANTRAMTVDPSQTTASVPTVNADSDDEAEPQPAQPEDDVPEFAEESLSELVDWSDWKMNATQEQAADAKDLENVDGALTANSCNAVEYRMGQRRILIHALEQLEALEFDSVAQYQQQVVSPPSVSSSFPCSHCQQRSNEYNAWLSSIAVQPPLVSCVLAAPCADCPNADHAAWFDEHPEARNRMMVMEDVAAQISLLALRSTDIISLDSASASESFGSAIDAVAGVDEEVMLALFLLHEYSKLPAERVRIAAWIEKHRKPKSKRASVRFSGVTESVEPDAESAPTSVWAAWLQTLPAPAHLDAACAWHHSQLLPHDDDEREQHFGISSICAAAAESEQELWADTFAQLFPALCDAMPDVFPSPAFTWTRFKWALGVVRSCSANVLLTSASSNAPNRQSSVCVLPLLAWPQLTLLPEAAAPALSAFRAGAGIDNHCNDASIVSLRSLCRIERDAEPVIVVDECRSALDCLMQRGSTCESGDSVTLSLDLPDALSEEKVQTLRSRCLDFRNFSIDSSAQLPSALIDTVTVLATAESNVSALVADAKSALPSDSKTRKRTRATLISVISQVVDAYCAPEEPDQHMDSTPAASDEGTPFSAECLIMSERRRALTASIRQRHGERLQLVLEQAEQLPIDAEVK